MADGRAKPRGHEGSPFRARINDAGLVSRRCYGPNAVQTGRPIHGPATGGVCVRIDIRGSRPAVAPVAAVTDVAVTLAPSFSATVAAVTFAPSFAAAGAISSPATVTDLWIGT
jgi:hypothetical protein